jgi:hypothetical protein
MSPLQIRMLLHYYCRTNDYQAAEDRAHACSIAVYEAMRWFVSEDVLKPRYGDLDYSIRCAVPGNGDPRAERPLFSITEKGRAMVQHLCAVQVPVCKWVQPETAA